MVSLKVVRIMVLLKVVRITVSLKVGIEGSQNHGIIEGSD